MIQNPNPKRYIRFKDANPKQKQMIEKHYKPKMSTTEIKKTLFVIPEYKIRNGKYCGGYFVGHLSTFAINK